ncbi:unnamed protein product, partial [Brachionus calyciflorus]
MENVGCLYCYHPGERKYGKQKYPPMKMKLRSDDEFKEIAKISENKQTTFGIKGECSLLKLSIPLLIDKLPIYYFNMLASYVIAIRILYEPILDLNLITVAEKILDNYIKSFDDSFGESSYNYTIHAHLHLPYS